MTLVNHLIDYLTLASESFKRVSVGHELVLKDGQPIATYTNEPDSNYPFLVVHNSTVIPFDSTRNIQIYFDSILTPFNQIDRYSKGLDAAKIAKKHSVPIEYILQQLEIGIRVEREHGGDYEFSKQIALDHLTELPNYYTLLDEMERKGKEMLQKNKKGASE